MPKYYEDVDRARLAPTPRAGVRRGGHQALAELEAFFPLMQESDAAEARGDAATALDLIAARPDGLDGKCFWRPRESA